MLGIYRLFCLILAGLVLIPLAENLFSPVSEGITFAYNNTSEINVNNKIATIYNLIFFITNRDYYFS